MCAIFQKQQAVLAAGDAGVNLPGNSSLPERLLEGRGDEATADLSDRIQLPAGMSFRMRNLFLLELDLQARLGNWLAEEGVA